MGIGGIWHAKTSTAVELTRWSPILCRSFGVTFGLIVGVLYKPRMAHAGNWGSKGNEGGIKRNQAHLGLQPVSSGGCNEVRSEKGRRS